MTPLPLPAFLAGTLAGMSVWSVVYASLGGASRLGFKRKESDICCPLTVPSKCLQDVWRMSSPCVITLVLTKASGLQVCVEIWSRSGGPVIRSGSSCLYIVLRAPRTPVPLLKGRGSHAPAFLVKLLAVNAVDVLQIWLIRLAHTQRQRQLWVPLGWLLQCFTMLCRIACQQPGLALRKGLLRS